MVFEAKDKYFDTDKKPVIMGIINITPDSFSDGGKYQDAESAFRRCAQMISEGADIIDIGGESSRPGSKKVSSEEETERILPVIRKIRKESDICISVDTYKADVAAAALEEGADMINNIYGAEPDQELLKTVASYSAGLCLMHMRGDPETMQRKTEYIDIIKEVYSALKKSYEAALNAGVPEKSVMFDPGIGFGKSVEGNLRLIKHISELRKLGRPVMIGASRKSFIGGILNNSPEERLSGTIAANVSAYLHGAGIFRVHDVKENAEALKTAFMIELQNVVDNGRSD